jgi:hypothetical protein
MRARAFLVLAAIGLAAFVGGLAAARDGEPRPISWLDEKFDGTAFGPPERRNVPRIPRGGRRCEPAELRYAPVEHQGLNFATTHYYVAVRNAGETPCVLAGLPAIEVERNAGGPLTIEEARDLFVVPGYPAAAPAFGLAAGKEASVGFALHHGRCEPRAPHRRLLVRVGASQGTGRRIPLGSCEAGVGLAVGSWQPPPLPEVAEEPQRWPLEAEIDAPSEARTGDVLFYRVKLRNLSDRAFRFPYCPLHASGFDGRDSIVAQLNCEPVGVLEPREAAVFEMRARISPHFAPGRHELGWNLDDRVWARTPLALRRP